MYKVFFKPLNADIYYPHKTRNKSIRILEVGKNQLSPPYDSELMHRDIFVLQYVISGKGMYNDIPFEAPCILLMIPDMPQRYTINENCDDFRQLWIKFDGTETRAFLENSGFSVENKIFPCAYIDKVISIFDNLTNLQSYMDNDDELYMLSGFFNLLALHSATKQQNIPKKISPYTQQILNYIHENYASYIDEPLLAQLVHLSVNYMHKIFVRDMRLPPIHYVTHYRLRCAKKLLKESNMTVTKIAEAVGLSSGNYFCRLFSKYNDGISPSKYRKKNTKMQKE
ncbi:MAG: helix-turn-helix transcriptional regulator [Clostridia bacterium]|nr:helix-turn-helix transcriptional regulator [Clostridia bacterium]